MIIRRIRVVIRELPWDERAYTEFGKVMLAVLPLAKDIEIADSEGVVLIADECEIPWIGVTVEDLISAVIEDVKPQRIYVNVEA